jgi:hypothetical protein
MKFSILFSLLCALTPLFGEAKTEDKTYLNASQIALQENQIFVFINNQWQSAEALFSDANGIYLLGRKWYETWECGVCGAMNPPHPFVCWRCNS